MGNICRSPTAEGVFRHIVKQKGFSDKIRVDSAGTHAYHIGESPDSRSQSTALSRGVNLSSQKARKVEAEDFDRFDYVIAMDRSNMANLGHLQEDGQPANLHLFMDFAKDLDNIEVPDPYYGEGDGFDRVFDMIQSASEGLLAHIVQNDFS